MGKGTKHTTTGARKSSNYAYKKRCESIGCKKRSKYFIKGKYYCRIHCKEV